MPEVDPNEILLEERNFLTELLSEFDDVEIPDAGVGMGQADFVYERDGAEGEPRRRVNVTIRLEEPV